MYKRQVDEQGGTVRIKLTIGLKSLILAVEHLDVYKRQEIDNPNPCSETTSGVVPNLQSRESE